MDNKNTYEVTKFLVSKDGEILKEIKENDEVTIKSPKQISNEEYQKYKQAIQERDEFLDMINKECGTFYFKFLNGKLFDMNIKESIKLRFLFLCTYTNYIEKGMYLVLDNGHKMTRKDLKEKLKLEKREFNITIKAMLENKLIFEANNYYKINSDLVCRGEINKNNESIYSRIFDIGLRELYNNCTPRQHKQLYYIFRLLPYTNLKFNIICKNPREEDIKEVMPLRLNEISEMLNLSKTNASKLRSDLLKLRMFDQYVIVGVTNKTGMFWKMNPRVSYSGTKGHLEEFKKLMSTDFSVK